MKIPAYDTDGHLLATIDEPCAQRAIARREAVRTTNGIQLRPSVARPLRSLTPEEQRRYFQKHGRSFRL